jgi:peptide/nickel transport system ATP-binding protein
MHQGLIVEEGPTHELYAKPQQDYTRRLLQAAPAALPPLEAAP